MAHNSYVKGPSGTWVTLDVVSAAQFTTFDQTLFKCINGDDGGSWSPSTPVSIGGAGLRLTGGVEHEINDASKLIVRAGSIETGGGEAILTTAGLVIVSGNHYQNGGVLEINGGYHRAAATGAVRATVAAGIRSDTAGGIATSVAGGLKLAGGSSDWPTFDARTVRRIRSTALCAPVVASGWTSSSGVLIGPATSTAQFFEIDGILDRATLTAVRIYMVTLGPHTSVPANLPAVRAIRRNVSTGVNQDLLSSTFSAFPTPATAGDWDNSGDPHYWELTCDQNNTSWDSETDILRLQIIDEYGANSASGNQYYGIQLVYSAADLRCAG